MPATFKRCFCALYGLTLEIRWQGAACRQAVDELLALFPFSAGRAMHGKADLVLSLGWSEVPAQVPETATETQDVYGLKILSVGDERIVVQADCAFRAQPSAGRAHITLNRSFVEQTALARSNFFLVGMFQLLLARGLFDLHAAGLVRKDGGGYLLLGESGSGKSTASLSLALQGWRYLSDDALLIRQVREGVEAFGFRRQFYIQRDTARHWPSVAAELDTTPVPADAKQFLDLERLSCGQRQDTVVPRVLVFCQIVPESRTSLTRMDQTSSLVRLLGQSASLSFNRAFAPQHLDTLKRLAAQSQSYQLLAGRDVYEQPDHLAAILGEIEVSAKGAVDDVRPPALEGTL